MKINYNNKKFKPSFNSANGEISDEMIFHYKQTDNVVTCSYSSKKILSGHLIGLVNKEGIIEINYHQVNIKGELRTGICKSIPKLLENGKIQLSENWQWTSGDKSKGNSILEEV